MVTASDVPSVRSPKGYPVDHLDGSPDELESRGDYLEKLSDTMRETSDSLKTISEGTSQISEAVDKVREGAEEVYGSLNDAATRYQGTGSALKTYGGVLRVCEENLGPLADEIPEARAAMINAKESVQDARSSVHDAEGGLFHSEGTDAEKRQAATDLENAESGLTGAENHLDELWEDYETWYEVWEDGYDTAIDSIESAIEMADNNDSLLNDILDGFLTFLGWVCVAAGIVAMIVGGPIAAAIMIGVAVATAVSLAGHIYLVTQGRATMTDVAFDIVGLVPMARPLAGAARSAPSILRGARSASAFTTRGGLVRDTARNFASDFAGRMPSPPAGVRSAWQGASSRSRGTHMAADVIDRVGNSGRYLYREIAGTGNALQQAGNVQQFADPFLNEASSSYNYARNRPWFGHQSWSEDVTGNAVWVR